MAPVPSADPVDLYTSHGNATMASRSPICETNWPAQSSKKLPLRASDAGAGELSIRFDSMMTSRRAG